MAIKRQPFNLRRFLFLFGLFAALAALMIFTKPNQNNLAGGHPFPVYNLHLKSASSKGTISLNDIVIASHKSGPELRESVIALTPWMKNGENNLSLSFNQTTHQEDQPVFEAELKIQYPDGSIDERKVEIQKQGKSKSYLIRGESLPIWQWQKGKANYHNFEEVIAVVKTLHQAFQKKNRATIDRLEQALFIDMERLTGREGLKRREYRKEIILKGEVEPLQRLIIIPFHNGKVIKVTAPDGEAPIRVYYRYGDGGKVILTGKYWSKINGAWTVVR